MQSMRMAPHDAGSLCADVSRPHRSLSDTAAQGGEGPERQTQAEGTGSFWLYIGCFILRRLIHAEVGWAWANAPYVQNKVGL